MAVDRLSQFGDPGAGRVLGEVVLDGLDRGRLDVIRCREIWLASAQIDDIDTLALELLDANISWMSASLSDTSLDVPEAEQGNYEMVLERLRHYRDRYGRTGQ